MAREGIQTGSIRIDGEILREHDGENQLDEKSTKNNEFIHIVKITV